MKIGNIELKNNLILAPMAGVTDLPFRLLCKEQGCSMVYTEMVSAKAISYNNQNTFDLMKIEEKEHPVALQLFGSEPDIVGKIAGIVSRQNFDIIDINMGCPVPKIVNNNEGSALLKNPKRIEEILTAMVKESIKPVTVKIRSGFDEEHINGVEIAKIAESCGVSAIAVHGRTRVQYYSGKADWNIIKAIKENVSIPVIGNGDINSGKAAKEILDFTKCDGIMIGRAAKGNPWIFNEIIHYLNTGEELKRPDNKEIARMILEHGKLMIKYKGEYIGMHEMRKHISWYTTGMPNSASLRNSVNIINTYEDLETIVKNYLN